MTNINTQRIRSRDRAGGDRGPPPIAQPAQVPGRPRTEAPIAVAPDRKSPRESPVALDSKWNRRRGEDGRQHLNIVQSCSSRHKNYFWFQLWLQMLTVCSQFPIITSINTVEKRLLAHTSENRAKTAVSWPLEAKQEVEIWRRPENSTF